MFKFYAILSAVSFRYIFQHKYKYSTVNAWTHKSTKIKLVWPFTSNAGRENGKKSILVETDVNKTTRETNEQMGR